MIRIRARNQEGATAVIVALVLVVLIGIIALTIDGGLLWVKYRQIRTANDAAALSWARSCADDEAATAQGDALVVAQSNVSDAELYPDYPQFGPEGCSTGHGTVTVRYGGEQQLMFGPAVGISSPKQVVASATAIWGAAGGSDNVVPLMLSAGRLTDCDIPDGTPPVLCHFWWDDDWLSQASWAALDLPTWGRDPPVDNCQSSGGNVNDWLRYGYPEPLLMETNPTYVCALTGVHQNISNRVGEQVPRSFLFPVNDPSKQLGPDGVTLCPPQQNCELTWYAIIGFAEMTVTRIERGAQARAMCPEAPPEESGNNFHCIEATWTGWNTTGYRPGEGTSFGIVAVGLKE